MDDLANLENEALLADRGALPVAAIEQQLESVEAAQPAHDEVAELAGLITIVAAMFAPVFPSLGKIYTQETINSLASSTVPVMVKRGRSVASLLGQYAEEFALLVVAAPVALATYQGIKADIEAKSKPEKSDTQPILVAPVVASAPVQDRA